jgi:hypothetical protein
LEYHPTLSCRGAQFKRGSSHAAQRSDDLQIVAMQFRQLSIAWSFHAIPWPRFVRMSNMSLTRAAKNRSGTLSFRASKLR